ncbi:GNAT family N-acetyltransferase [Bacillus massiliglaciei]|uniref:GNAT family N-acetyltransferase n=1 Tax=Bacillus massiliglaciei TaxID=1816693 RepID=UPI000DA5F45A|nr:GNAT family N-acetyltransferase [Bacillus massiliglaciei]
MQIVAKQKLASTEVHRFFVSHWNGSEKVNSQGIYNYAELDGFAVLNEQGFIIGLGTYVLRDDELEIVTLDSDEWRKGIGTSLLHVIENIAYEQGCKSIKVVTTNDNLDALKFLQKRGYSMDKIVKDAVAESRKIKPEIPYYSPNGIPIKDEMILTKQL